MTGKIWACVSMLVILLLWSAGQTPLQADCLALSSSFSVGAIAPRTGTGLVDGWRVTANATQCSGGSTHNQVLWSGNAKATYSCDSGSASSCRVCNYSYIYGPKATDGTYPANPYDSGQPFDSGTFDACSSTGNMTTPSYAGPNNSNALCCLKYSNTTWKIQMGIGVCAAGTTCQDNINTMDTASARVYETTCPTCAG